MNSSLHGQNAVVYDLEIKNVIDGKKIGWGDKHLMGISVGVAFDYLTSEFRVFMDDNLGDLAKLLNRAEIVSGFNIVDFDNPLLNASLKTIPPEPLKLVQDAYTNTNNVYDLLVESRAAGKIDRFAKGMRLDDHLKATFGPEHVKTDDGAEAPLMWQRNELGRLISYCIGDVKRECMLFEHAWHRLPISTANHGSRVLRHPTDRRV